jgi:hypothetical protein
MIQSLTRRASAILRGSKDRGSAFGFAQPGISRYGDAGYKETHELSTRSFHEKLTLLTE